ncbi:MAG: asparaginyl-tRNA synthetase [Vezdaea aestivalis]|nr:MAG: asparaginyl-tRNA synthetase [Vezdaea aestivalis]
MLVPTTVGEHGYLYPALAIAAITPLQLGDKVCGRAASPRQFSNTCPLNHVPLRSTIASLLASRRRAEIPVSSDQAVTINGFVRSVRKQKKVAFAALGDGSTTEPLQVVLSPEQASRLSAGSAVKVVGNWQACAPGLKQSHEVLAQDIEVFSVVDAESYPLQKKHQTAEYLRTIPHLRHRTTFGSLLLQLRSQCITSVTQFFNQHDFVQTHPPIITSSDCEGAGQVFGVDTAAPSQPDDVSNPPKADSSAQAIPEPFFRDPKYLTVSTQLHLEALAQSVGRVWTLSPTFRAEHSDTARHLSEFYMLEAEHAFTSSLEDVMSVVESLLRSLTHNLSLSPVGKNLLEMQRYEEGETKLPLDATSKALMDRWNGLMARNWPRITYTDSIDLLNSANDPSIPKLSWGDSLQSSHERHLASLVGKGSPVFVTDYPTAIKPFYMLPSSSAAVADRPTVAAFDLLLPELCEIAGGSLREHRLDQLVAAMQRQGLVHGKDKELDFGSLQWYIDLRRWGTVPHGGFGIGFDRLLAYLAGVSNVREVVAFPRWFGRCDC